MMKGIEMLLGRLNIKISWFKFGIDWGWWNINSYPLKWKFAFYFIELKKLRDW